MPAANSIEWNAEELIIGLLGNEVRLEDFDIRHHNSPEKAKVDTVLGVRAVPGDNRLDGVKGFDVNVTITLGHHKGIDNDRADEIVGAMKDALYEHPDMTGIDLPDVYFASIEPECATIRDDTGHVRVTKLTVPMIVKLIA